MRKVTRNKDIPSRLGCGRTKADEILASGEINLFPLTPGGRVKVAFDDEIDAYLERQAKKAVAAK